MTQLSREATGIRFRSDGTVPVVEVVGDLDLGDLHAFEEILQRAFGEPSQDVIVSLAEASYFNSGGVRLVMRLADRLAQDNRRLLLVAPRDRTPRRVLDIIYMTSDLLPFESVEEALGAQRLQGL
jgi:anti-anti-sigma factor